MAYWLFSTEPDNYPWQKVAEAAGLPAGRQVRWDGIRGYPAQKAMRLIKPGDAILAYHASPEKAVVGVAKAVSTSYSDPSVPVEEREKWHVIDVAWDRWLPRPVPIAAMRKCRALSKMKFLIMPRLSISPVAPPEWKALLGLARASPPPPLPMGEGRRQSAVRPSPCGRGGTAAGGG
jgi:predicted RNA-binding protein with PUA-like domain